MKTQNDVDGENLIRMCREILVAAFATDADGVFGQNSNEDLLKLFRELLTKYQLRGY